MKTATGSRKYGFQIALIWAVVTVFTGSALAEEAYKVGGIFSVTGRASFLGDPEKKSMEMAIDAVNAAGGIDGRKLEAVIYDTEGDPTKAVMGISKLLNKDNVLAVIGPSTDPHHPCGHALRREDGNSAHQLRSRQQDHPAGQSLGVQNRSKRHPGRPDDL